jgi:hypothetical protein
MDAVVTSRAIIAGLAGKITRYWSSSPASAQKHRRGPGTNADRAREVFIYLFQTNAAEIESINLALATYD